MVNIDVGFSMWLDFIERDFLKKDFKTLIEKDIINGATSNPAIFASAIITSKAYQEQLELLKELNPKDKYEALAIEDIKNGAIALRETYDSYNDGYISIEIDPFLSNDTKGSLDEARRLFRAIDEPNVMIKVPATEAGYEVMGTLIQEGISVNATLVFSPTQAQKCLEVMSNAMRIYDNSGGGRVEAVISVFVSRFDRLMDNQLEDKAKLGIMNASKIYNLIQKKHSPAIKTLFASTGVKGDSLPQEYYINELYAPHSINTAPLNTIEAFINSNPSQKPKLPMSEDDINEYFNNLKDKGVDMDSIYNKLFNEGLKAFEISFKDMLESLK
ncbi:Transaldolase [hydrothermal vent metagenome]|uniref:Transaldolase n=1 Tax=hydrothermal vent metagenome TaxID=652676 RepID=A0A1W1EJ61_9ZZZZ